ncbi:MAG: efflux RND transporter periplasmic adaptor subunit [Pseudomonadota bacterium]
MNRSVTAILLATLILSACSEPQPEPVSVARPVKYFTVGGGSGDRQRVYPGVVRAADSAQVGFEVAGRVTQLTAKEGQRVEAGEELARLDPRDYEADLEIATADLRKAQADLQRSQNIQAEDPGAITNERIDEDKRAVEVAQAQVSQARKAVDDTVLRAPFAGVVSERLIEEFENVQAKQSVVIVENLDEMEVEVNVPERDVAASSNGGQRGFDAQGLATLTSEVMPVVSLSSRPTQAYPARFTEVATRADPATRTFAVRMAVETPDDVVLLPGMTARVTGRFQGSGVVVNIPITALSGSPDGNGAVWVIDPQTNTVSQRRVEVGELVADQVIILSGLAPGEVIAGTGAPLLSEGMQVSRFE